MLTVAGHYKVPAAARRRTGVLFQLEVSRNITSVTRGRAALTA